MRANRQRRVLFIVALLMGLSVAIGLSLYALRHSISLYLTPSQLLQQKNSLGRSVRLGGLVKTHSVKHVKNSVNVGFVLTDFHHTVRVRYHGVLPSLFREGQGIVAEGHLNQQGEFIATRVLAKHDATYRPPGIPQKGVRR